jgi:hypothetical protein
MSVAASGKGLPVLGDELVLLQPATRGSNVQPSIPRMLNVFVIAPSFHQGFGAATVAHIGFA